MSQIERLYWIDDQIRTNRYPNTDKVVAYFGGSRRAAFADCKHLKDRLHAPILFSKGHNGWYYSDTTYMLPYLALTEKESAGLRRSLFAAQEYLGPAEAEVLSLVIDRLALYIPNPTSPETIRGSLHFAHEATHSEALFQDCRKAIRNRQKLWIRYYGIHRNEVSELVRIA